jgi:hypothetical protein
MNADRNPFHAAATRPRDELGLEDGSIQRDKQAGQSEAQDIVSTPTKRAAAVLWPGLTALTVCLVWMILGSRSAALPPPFEDAAMLFKYAENLAHGYGITWNAGQDPGLTDGATDLGFVLAIAPLVALGLPAVSGALLINLAAVFGIGALFGALNHRLWHQPLWLPIALAAFVASGPTSLYVLSGYSPPVLGFLLLAAFALAVAGAVARTDRQSLLFIAAAGAAAGVTGWWRPEGFAFGLLAVLSGLLITMHAIRRPLSTVTALLTPYLLLLLAWVIFRITYFGQLLPTSAVMKGGSFHPSNALFSVQFYGSLLLPVVGVLLVAAKGSNRGRSWWLSAAALVASLVWINAAIKPASLAKRGLAFLSTVSDVATVAIFIPVLVVLAVAGVRRRDRSWLFPVALVACSLGWVAIATTLNHFGRMQWPLVPVLASIGVTSAMAVPVRHPISTTRDSSARRTPVIVLALLSCVGVLSFAATAVEYRQYVEYYKFHTSVSSALSVVDTSGVRLATTEAGVIPLAVTGPALDTWGYNNRSIAATHGRSLQDELTGFQPNMLAVEGPPPNLVHTSDVQPSECRQRRPEWSEMVTTMYEYARQHGVVLARISETNPCEFWSLWLSADVGPQIRNAVDHLEMPGTELQVSRTP